VRLRINNIARKPNMNTAPSDRTRICRIAENANYERETLYAIIDEAYLCHIAVADAKGSHCIPTACWREGDHLYIHGSNGGRLTKLLNRGTQACVTITHLDGLVLARSAFNHSMNYRSCMIYGQFEAVREDAGKRASMDALMRKIAAGRELEARRGSDKEFAATTVLRIALTEAACKLRRGPAQDDEADLHLPVWAGVLPMQMSRSPAIADPGNTAACPGYVSDWAEDSPLQTTRSKKAIDSLPGSISPR
jgi:nitroimidazol reductase NimA-like FMN-containing flavoprotein (pyridoxamine 5'-phosphate oxidase superfamily)